jgi:hypothetical protein
MVHGYKLSSVQDLGCSFTLLGLGYWVQGLGFRVPDVVRRVSGFGFGISV